MHEPKTGKMPSGQQAMAADLVRINTLILISILGIFIISALLLTYVLWGFYEDMDKTDEMAVYHNRYDIDVLGDSPRASTIKYGRELFDNTPKYLGPESEAPYAGNRLSCTNCHLQSGTKPYAAPLIGIVQRFPQFRKRENKMGSLEERINGCMLRSMNGSPLPTDSKEMKALIAYMEWLGRYAPVDGKIKGQGFVRIALPNRPVDLEAGKMVFEKHCIPCHGDDGKGKKAAIGQGYLYPPLWGADSYNNGAGMTRVITAANFIKGNMPFGATFDKPVLTDEEAYDVAGYINRMSRPKKKGLDRDYPDLKKKPLSSPYGPFADHFPLEQHQLGPYPPIVEYYKNQYRLIKNQ